MKKIDPNSISTPNIVVTNSALQQIFLALKNDPYNVDKYFRIHISGKGCDGFTYQCFFDEINEDDIILELNSLDQSSKLIIAPFTAYYLQEAIVDFEQDMENDLEGFVVKNKNQKKYHGKFWRQNPELTPSNFKT